MESQLLHQETTNKNMPATNSNKTSGCEKTSFNLESILRASKKNSKMRFSRGKF